MLSSFLNTSRVFASTPLLSTVWRSLSSIRILSLNDLQNIPGAKKKRKRWGRGTGSGRGKMCGYGHQKSRSTPRAFEGGQTPLYKTQPKIGFHNHSAREFVPVNLDKLQQFIDMNRLIPKEKDLITILDLLECGIISRPLDGIKLLAKGKQYFKTPIHIEVSAASEEAVKAVEAVGGTVTSTHFNTLALRALMKPHKFEYLPMRARPPPRLMPYYLDRTKAGYLSPEVQSRNLKLFGYVTSEEKLREEHEIIMRKKLGLLANTAEIQKSI